MTRHLLTLFALLTGLAAIQAPAHASALDTSTVDARAIARAVEASAAENCVCQDENRQRDRRCPRQERSSASTYLPGWLRPVFVFGSERALE